MFGREKLVACRAEIRAIEKLDLASGVRHQKIEEAQMLGEALLDAEARIGALTRAIPQTRGANQNIDDTAVGKVETKSSVIEALGFTPKQVERFETLAKHPEIIEQIKAEAREAEDIPTRSEVLRRVAILDSYFADPVIEKGADMRKVFVIHRPADDDCVRGNVEAVFTSQERAEAYCKKCDIFPNEIFVLVLQPPEKSWPLPEKKT